jgi:2-keto-4-pentenoate hydratase/2-oxohepta-3-ene-1,7-dioic acid hydratase in catechol pathway
MGRKEVINAVKEMTMELKVNSTIMRRGNIIKIIFGVDGTIWYLPPYKVLEPEYFISAGTAPAVGMGNNPQQFLMSWDGVELRAEQLGPKKQNFIKS